MSLAGPANALLQRAVESAAAADVLMVAAAGNEGPRAGAVYPAAYPSVLAVTGVDRSRRAYRRAGQGEHIDISAPGVDVWTAASVSGARPRTGTSYAAPFVAAAAALWLARNAGARPDAVVASLTSTAEDLGDPGKDKVFGWGLLRPGPLCGSGGDQP
jgi:subtilisin family serine protease